MKNINAARELFHRYDHHISVDKTMDSLLSKYQNSIENTNRMMQDIGMVQTCGLCAEKMKGSCCFQEVEEWYDPILLLINLLLGIELPHSREIPGHCFFVGRNGCKLLARYSFCINFLCPGLKGSLKRQTIKDFLSLAGKELFHGWKVEQLLYEWLRTNSVTVR